MSYFKYDNNYWDTGKIKKLKKRILTYFLSSVILFNVYAIYARQPPSKIINFLYPKLIYGFDELGKDFPLRAISYANFLVSYKGSINQDNLNNYLERPNAGYDIKALIKKDKKEEYGEIGGAVMLVENNDGQKYLDFVEIESENMGLSKKIIQNRNNKKRLKKLFLSEREKFERLNEMGLPGDKLRRKKFEGVFEDKEIGEIAMSYTIASNDAYILGLERLIDSFYPLEIGKCIGIFHIHDDGGPPSESDISMSINFRSFVISNLGKKYRIYELADGEIKYFIEKDFKTQ